MTNRARSFGAVAADYAHHRPGYPDDAVAWALAPAPGPAVLDLGAGTGKLTAALARRPGLVITAVDPDATMLAQLRARLPDLDARVGSAELIPLPDASVDAVVAGQAWHWFDGERAMAEVARVLRPGGVLAALWNHDDETVDWVAGYHAVLDADRPVPGVPLGGGHMHDYPAHPAFVPAEREVFRHGQRVTVEGLLEVLRTHSWALVSPPAEREAALGRVRDYLGTRSELSGEFTLPLTTTVLRTLRR